MVSIQTSHVSSKSCQELRGLIQQSIDEQKPVDIDVEKDDKREVVRQVFFKEFTVKDLQAAGTTSNGDTVLVNFPRKDCEAFGYVLVVVGR
ncbi:MAG: hypothetical protein JWO54_135 [Candidatus Saccharibacteria bacterium]|nr:hypothetical protein [Candidatus Saccharibacteria bacterium]